MLPVLFTNRWNEIFPSLTEFERGFMPLDVREQGDAFVIEAEVPGVSKEQLNITVENGVLTIVGETRRESEEKKEHFHLRERRVGKIERSVVLPDTADTDKIAAKLEHGVLTLTIPVREEAKPRRVEVR